MKVLRLAWTVALTPLLWAQSGDVHSVLAAQRQAIQSADFRATGHLTWVQPSGARPSAPISIKAHWFPGVLRVMLEVGAADAAHPATHALLEMRPNGQNAIWIAHRGDKAPVQLPIEKWNDGPLGPGYSYEDFLEQQYFWSGQKAEGEVKYGARDCDLVRSTPGPASKTHYTEVKSWLDHSIGFPVYVEKAARESNAVKEFTYFGLRREEGRWSAHQVEVKIRGQAGSTLLVIDRGSPKANLTLNDFAPSQLTHF